MTKLTTLFTNTLAHLPATKQQELERITQLILDRFARNN